MASPALIWSFEKTGVELWSPSVGWNPQFTDRDRAFCAALWAHGKRRGLSSDEAEALALMRTWAQRTGGHLRYSPAQERRMAAIYAPVTDPPVASDWRQGLPSSASAGWLTVSTRTGAS